MQSDKTALSSNTWLCGQCPGQHRGILKIQELTPAAPHGTDTEATKAESAAKQSTFLKKSL